MTFDFVDALQEACEKEGIAFVVLIQAKDGQRATMRANLDNWINACDEISKREDVLEALDACIRQQEDSQ